MGASDSKPDIFSYCPRKGEKRTLYREEKEGKFSWCVQREGMSDVTTAVTVEESKCDLSVEPDVIVLHNSTCVTRIRPFPLYEDLYGNGSRLSKYREEIRKGKLLYFQGDDRFYVVATDSIICYNIKEENSGLISFSLRVWVINDARRAVRGVHFCSFKLIKAWKS